MRLIQKDTIREELLNILEQRLQMLGLEKSDIETGSSLFEQGIIDSIYFLELLMEIENKFGISFDFMVVNPREVSSIDSLVEYILTQ